jgi:hypothetical protein
VEGWVRRQIYKKTALLRGQEGRWDQETFLPFIQVGVYFKDGTVKKRPGEPSNQPTKKLTEAAVLCEV